jgi:hypothetical protein
VEVTSGSDKKGGHCHSQVTSEILPQISAVCRHIFAAMRGNF